MQMGKIHLAHKENHPKNGHNAFCQSTKVQRKWAKVVLPVYKKPPEMGWNHYGRSV